MKFKNIILISFLSIFINNILLADRLDDILKSKKIRVAVRYDFKPFGFVANNGEVMGFDIELAQYIANKLGVKAEFVQATPKTSISMILANQVDLAIVSMMHTATREKAIDFTMSYFFDEQLVVLDKKKLFLGPYGMGVAKNESRFKKAINQIIRKASLDGTYAKIYKKWFKKSPREFPREFEQML